MKIEIALTEGAIKNNYINLRGHLTKFSNKHIGSDDLRIKGKPLQLDIGGGDVFETDVCGKHQRFRNRTAMRILNVRNNLQPRDILIVERYLDDHWKVYRK
ncbi:hypothetical protein [Salinimonas lutimaris]|uniref:hypothetical protein n=1 Tax=Salinimonas lutimaris TaxID=914153 RepID=UPI0010C144D5|nr:hypothetical protein [Salinimonas lutimaris]